MFLFLINFLREGLFVMIQAARSADFLNLSTCPLVQELFEAILKRSKIVVDLFKSSRSHPETVEEVVY